MIILKWLCLFIDILCIFILQLCKLMSNYIMVWSITVEPKCYHWKECQNQFIHLLKSQTPPLTLKMLSSHKFSKLCCLSCLHLTNMFTLVILVMKPSFKSAWTANSLFLCCHHFSNFRLLYKYIPSVKKKGILSWMKVNFGQVTTVPLNST